MHLWCSQLFVCAYNYSFKSLSYKMLRLAIFFLSALRSLLHLDCSLGISFLLYFVSTAELLSYISMHNRMPNLLTTELPAVLKTGVFVQRHTNTGYQSIATASSDTLTRHINKPHALTTYCCVCFSQETICEIHRFRGFIIILPSGNRFLLPD